MTNYSRSVLKSNGLHRLKIQLIKFGFSPINTPANIAKKLPLQCCSKPLLITFFNFLHKRPTFAFTSESGYTLGFRRRIAHSGLHAETGGVSDGGGITTLSVFRTFTNIPGPGIRTANFAAFGSWSRGISKSTESLRNSDAHDARRCSEASRSRRNVQPRCWFLRCIGELHGLPSLRRNSGESFHAPCCADSFICAL